MVLKVLMSCVCSYSPVHQEVCCFNVVSHETRHLCKKHPQLSCILGPDLAVPVHEGAKTTRSHAALHLLGNPHPLFIVRLYLRRLVILIVKSS